MSEPRDPARLRALADKAKALDRDLPEGWYVEEVRPSRPDEARIYDRYSRGVVKPTCGRGETGDRQLSERLCDLRQFVTEAASLLRALAEEQEAGTVDYGTISSERGRCPWHDTELVKVLEGQFKGKFYCAVCAQERRKLRAEAADGRKP